MNRGDDGGWVRGVIAAVAAYDMGAAGLELLAHGGGRFGPAVLVGLAWFAGGWALWSFARRRRLSGGWFSLLVLAAVVEVAAYQSGGPYRAQFFSGTVLLGWLVGAALAGRAGRETQTSWAHTGAYAALAAPYVTAGLTKMLGVGAGFADAHTLRAIVLAHREIDGSWSQALADAVVAAPVVAQVLAAATVAIQLGAIAYPLHPRARMVCGVSLIGFHVGVAAIVGIGYWQPVALLVGLSFVRETESMGDDRLERAALIRIGLFGAMAILAAWALPWKRYTARHHAHQGQTSPPSRSRVEVGPLRVGQPLAAHWVIAGLVVEPTRVQVVITGAQQRAVLFVAPRHPGQSAPRSPFDTEAARIYYGATAVAFEELSAPADALAQRVDDATSDPQVVEAWLRR